MKLLIELQVSKTSPQNNSEGNVENDREIHRKRYISPEQRQKNYWWSKINIIMYNNGISKNNKLVKQYPK